MAKDELDGGDIVAPSTIEDTPTVSAAKRNAEEEVEKDETKKARVGTTLTGDDVKAAQAAHKDGPSAKADTVPEPRFEGSTKPVAAADDDDDEEDDEDDEEAGEGNDEDDSDEEISEDELAALQQEAGGADDEPAPATTGRRPTRTTRTVVDYKKANDELPPDEDDE